MKSIIVRVFVSSTWLDLQPERKAVESLLQRFRETKFLGMEYFGSSDETTRVASLNEVARSNLYLGIIGGRYGSGITEAEYDHGHNLRIPCFIYFKQDWQVQPENRDVEPERAKLLADFKAKLKDQSRGHLIAEFAGPYELASIVGSDLHNWLFEKHLGPALSAAAKGRLGTRPTRQLERSLREMAAINSDLQKKVAVERSVLDEQRRIATEAFYRLTYDIPPLLAQFPRTAEIREQFVRQNLAPLEQLYRLSDGAHEVLRELATNYRLLGTILLELERWQDARFAFEQSARHSFALVKLQPNNALYHRDLAVSYLNGGYVLEQLGDDAGARTSYEASLPSAERAAELSVDWSALPIDVRSRIERSRQRQQPRTIKKRETVR